MKRLIIGIVASCTVVAIQKFWNNLNWLPSIIIGFPFFIGSIFLYLSRKSFVSPPKGLLGYSSLYVLLISLLGTEVLDHSFHMSQEVSIAITYYTLGIGLSAAAIGAFYGIKAKKSGS